MVNLDMLLVATQDNWNTLWGPVFKAFVDWVGNYGWAIVVLTIVLRLLLSPLDYQQRKFSRKQAKVQKLMQPELNRIKSVCRDPQVQKQKMQEVQMKYMKKYKVMGASCFVMILSMVLSMVIFCSLFFSIRDITKSEVANNFAALNTQYEKVLEESGSEEQAQNAVLEYFESGELDSSWLWVKNVWRSERTISSIPTYKEFINESKFYSSNVESDNYISKEQYDKVLLKVNEKYKNSKNGYFILIILSGVVFYLSYQINMNMMGNGAKNNKKSNSGEPDPSQSMQKMMKYFLPIIMVYTTYISSAIFALYVVTNSIVMLGISFVCNKIIDKRGDGIDENAVIIDSGDYRIQKKTKIN